jgi:hypothetical protein
VKRKRGLLNGCLAALASATLATGCSRRLSDPPPPATSPELPAAAPGAIGAKRASLNPEPPPRAQPVFPNDESEDEQEADAGVQTEDDDAGVAL